MSKENILNEFAAIIAWGDFEMQKSWMANALDKYALSIVEQSLPEKLDGNPEVNGDDGNAYNVGFDDCREQTLQNAKKLTHA